MKILSFNIWDLPLWFVRDRETRISKIADYILKSDADIVCLQESFDVKHRAFLNARLKGGGYYTTDKELETRRVLFISFDVTGGLMTFSKFPILESRFQNFNRFLNGSIVEYFSRKGFLETLVKTPQGNIRIANTHLHKPSFFFDVLVRRRQISVLLEALRVHSEIPTIITGDFNQRNMLQRRGFAELFKQEGFFHPQKNKEALPQPTYRAKNPYVAIWANKQDDAERFDYIFIKNMQQLGLKAVRYEPDYLKPPLSDHDPVLLILEEKRENGNGHAS